jgi:hypothetical protein
MLVGSRALEPDTAKERLLVFVPEMAHSQAKRNRDSLWPLVFKGGLGDLPRCWLWPWKEGMW